MKRLRVLFTQTVILGTAALSLGQPSRAPSGFRALGGGEARRFVLPNDMRLVRSGVLSGYGLRWERYQQVQRGTPVMGAELTLHRNEAGDVVLVVGESYPPLVPANRVRLGASRARALAERDVGREGDWRNQLMFDPGSRRFFYRVENRRFASRWHHWIDAENGRVLLRYDGLATGDGIGVKGDVKDLTGLSTGNPQGFVLRSGDGRQTIRDARSRPLSQFLGFVLPAVLIGRVAEDEDDRWLDPDRTSPGQAALVDAAYYVSVTDSYYRDVHGRDSFDDGGKPITAIAHFSTDFSNAFWNSRFMVFGDGDGHSLREFSGALDVVAHEFTHGVTQFTSNLIYWGQSGALNESFSDIIGSSVEFFADARGLDPAGAPDWLISEDIDLSADTEPGFRNMADPAEDGDPDHFTERRTGGGDNGGVHTNSAVSNHAFYLLVNGGTNAGESRGHAHSGPAVAGIGLAEAERIFYLGFVSLPPIANMCRARLATQAAAAALSPASADSVSDAWEAVGVPDDCRGGAPTAGERSR
jgi:Zn-dependent metalloprotease